MDIKIKDTIILTHPEEEGYAEALVEEGILKVGSRYKVMEINKNYIYVRTDHPKYRHVRLRAICVKKVKPNKLPKWF